MPNATAMSPDPFDFSSSGSGTVSQWNSSDLGRYAHPTSPPTSATQMWADIPGAYVVTSFSFVPAGRYDLWVTYQEDVTNGSTGVYNIDGQPIGEVNFKNAPSVVHDGVSWKLVGSLNVSDTGYVHVRLEHKDFDATPGRLLFDAIRLAPQEARTTYQYDHKGRLLKVEQFDFHDQLYRTVRYGYDATGRKVGRTVVGDFNRDGFVENRDATGYVYDGINVLAEVSFDEGDPANNNRIARTFFLGPGVNEVLAIDDAHTQIVTTSSSGLPSTSAAMTATIWTFPDARGSARSLGWYLGGSVWKILHRGFIPYGESEQPIGDLDVTSMVSSPALWAGHQADPDTHLVDMKSRWFDPATGRFLSEDPLGFAAGDLNLYRYGLGDPVNTVDPQGTEPITIGLLILGGLLYTGGAAGTYYYADQMDRASGGLGFLGTRETSRRINEAAYYDAAVGFNYSFRAAGIGAGMLAAPVSGFALSSMMLEGAAAGGIEEGVFSYSQGSNWNQVFTDAGQGAAFGAAFAGGLAVGGRAFGTHVLRPALMNSAHGTLGNRVYRATLGAGDPHLGQFINSRAGGICFDVGSPVQCNPQSGDVWFVAAGLALAGTAAGYATTEQKRRRRETHDDCFASADGLAEDNSERDWHNDLHEGADMQFDQLCDQLFNSEDEFWSDADPSSYGPQVQQRPDSYGLKVQPKSAQGGHRPKVGRERHQPRSTALGYELIERQSPEGATLTRPVVVTPKPATQSVNDKSSSLWRKLNVAGLFGGLLLAALLLAKGYQTEQSTTRKIEDVRPAQKVIVDAPQEALATDIARLTERDVSWNASDGSLEVAGVDDPLRVLTDATPEQVTKAEYRLIRLRAYDVWADGTLDQINVQTLQPWQWIQQHEAHVGAFAPLPLDALEMGLPEGMTGTVDDILPCPEFEQGRGRIVLTTVNHLNNNVIELTLQNEAGKRETLRPTGTHKFYSVSSGEWLSASELQPGETLDGLNGKVTVVASRTLPGTRRVYNFTVQGEHLYRVANCGVLVHNNGCAMAPISGLKSLQGKLDDLAETHLLPKFRKLDPNLEAGYTGSFKTGTVGNPYKATFGQPIDLNKFDVDYWIKSDVLYEKFGNSLKADVEFRKILANTPGFEGLKPNKQGFSIKFLPSTPR